MRKKVSEKIVGESTEEPTISLTKTDGRKNEVARLKPRAFWVEGREEVKREGDGITIIEGSKREECHSYPGMQSKGVRLILGGAVLT